MKGRQTSNLIIDTLDLVQSSKLGYRLASESETRSGHGLISLVAKLISLRPDLVSDCPLAAVHFMNS